jgi:hypothetical protein
MVVTIQFMLAQEMIWLVLDLGMIRYMVVKVMILLLVKKVMIVYLEEMAKMLFWEMATDLKVKRSIVMTI